MDLPFEKLGHTYHTRLSAISSCFKLSKKNSQHIPDLQKALGNTLDPSLEQNILDRTESTAPGYMFTQLLFSEAKLCCFSGAI